MAPEIISKVQSLVSGESKSARKKKAKADTSAAAVPASPENVSSEQGATGSNAAEKVNGESENAYIKELQKNIRNINKKLNATQKVDSIIAANPGISLDDLVATRKINADQKAQAQKKPGLQAQLAQLEEQVTQYKKFDQEYQDKLAREKELMRESHAGELDELKNTLKAEAELEQKKVFREKALTLSRFLRAAAARRQLEEDDSELTKAFEGALLQVYGGDALAVTAIEKLIEGAEEGVPSTENIILSVTYSEVKRAALEEAPFAAEEAWIDEVAQSQAVPPENEGIEAVSDPTVAHAGLTELDAGEPALNSETAEASTAPAATNIEAEAANDTAKEQWDKQVAGQGELPAEPYETIPRDPAETETPHTTAAVNSTQSWADDATETSPAPAAPATGDGFHEVQHNRGGRGRGGQHQGEGRGGYRGRGRGGARGNGEYRGRGRGRGDFRGSRGGFRGAPRGESS